MDSPIRAIAQKSAGAHHPRSDGHFTHPEQMALRDHAARLHLRPGVQPSVAPKAEPLLTKARTLRQNRLDNGRRTGTVRLYDDLDCKARSWAKTYCGCSMLCAAYSLHENTLCHTKLARAQPMSIILKLFKLAVRVVQYKDRIKLHLPNACPVKGLLHWVSELLYFVHPPPLRS